MAECVIEDEENVGRQHVGHSKVFLIQEVKRVAEGILSDQVAGESSEDIMHRQDITSLAGIIHPGKQLSQVLLNDRLQPANAGGGEETTDSVAASAVHVMINSRDDRFSRWRKQNSSQLL